MKEIFIFDIDGCVLSQIFPNIYENNNTNEEFIKVALKKSENIFLFEEFIRFYEKYCKNAFQIYFITGRQEHYFSEITEKQLFPLKSIRTFKIIYYPDDKSHTAEEYFNWKIEIVGEIFEKYAIAFNTNENLGTELIFKIFDDMDEYFPRLKEISKKYEFKNKLVSISSPEIWKSLIS